VQGKVGRDGSFFGDVVRRGLALDVRSHEPYL
jgi:hypothetical protein